MSGYDMDGKPLQQLDSVAETLKEQFERRRFWFLCGFSLVYLGITCLLASRKLMWNDELFTFYIARLPSLSDVWSALSTGADQIPPFFHVLTRASFAMLGVNHLSVRLPEILGFWLMSLCLFRFVAKRSSALYGFVAMLFPLITTAYDYAYEARPYGLVLGFGGFALLCWQSAAEAYARKLSLVGLAVSLAAAVSSHYYGVLLFFPLAVGEMVRSCSRRRLDLPVWGAFGFGLLPLLLFFPLVESARTYSASFWAQPRWGAVPEFYYFLLIPAVFPLVAVLILSAIYATTPPLASSRPDQESDPPIPVHEIAAAFGFVAVPVIAVMVAKLLTGAFTYRYALPSVMGFSILLAFAASRLLNASAILGIALILSFFGGYVMLQVRSIQETSAVSQELTRSYKFLQSKAQGNLTIAASDLHTFMILAYYAPPDIVSRLVYVADPELSVLYVGYSTIDQGILDLKPWFGLKIEQYDIYVASLRPFWVYVYGNPLNWRSGRNWLAANRGSSGFNWLLAELTATNRKIDLRAQNGENFLFLVNSSE
jgi:Dolichyl-phosphate-mannose-protein mannosyltransferase